MVILRIRVSNRLIFCYMSCLRAAKAQPFVLCALFKNYGAVQISDDAWGGERGFGQSVRKCAKGGEGGSMEMSSDSFSIHDKWGRNKKGGKKKGSRASIFFNSGLEHNIYYMVKQWQKGGGSPNSQKRRPLNTPQENIAQWLWRGFLSNQFSK